MDDLEAMRHDVLVAGSTLAERSRALLWAGGVRETDMNLVMLSVLEEVMERAAASPSRGPPVLLASADEHWSPESNRQGLSDTAGDRAGVAVLGSTLLLTTGAVAAPAVVAVYRSASAVAMLRSAAAVKEAGIFAKDGVAVTGFTKHGVDRAIGDGARRAGTRPDAILDAIKNPTKIKEGIDTLGRPFKVYTGENARVVVNPETGKIISTNPLARKGAHPQ